MSVDLGKRKTDSNATPLSSSALPDLHFPFSHALDLLARQVVEGFIVGRHRSPFHGFSAEFSDYRQYNTGESTRHIDWPLYARTDKLFVKQFEEETNLRCQLLIDHSGSMLFPVEGMGDVDHPNKLTFSVCAAAVLIEILHRQRDAFGLSLISNGIDLQTPCRSSGVHQRYLLGLLAHLIQSKENHGPETHLAEALHLTAESLHRRSLVVIFSDAFLPDSERDDLFDALRHLRHNKHEVILFHTLDRSHEVDLAYDNRPYRFIDLETGTQANLRPNLFAQEYARQMNAQVSELQHRAMQYKIDYVPVDVADGFQQTILPFLLRRSKL